MFDLFVVVGRRLVGDDKLDLIECCCCVDLAVDAHVDGVRVASVPPFLLALLAVPFAVQDVTEGSDWSTTTCCC